MPPPEVSRGLRGLCCVKHEVPVQEGVGMEKRGEGWNLMTFLRESELVGGDQVLAEKERLLRIGEVLEITGFSKSVLYEMVNRDNLSPSRSHRPAGGGLASRGNQGMAGFFTSGNRGELAVRKRRNRIGQDQVDDCRHNRSGEDSDSSLESGEILYLSNINAVDVQAKCLMEFFQAGDSVDLRRSGWPEES